ncbi:hypothetical protein [Streptomyces sp. NBC_00207]|uniref:hypothetical protein n=1 Tax=unclassified Streptomyces TaxID=2593676 RepID=UPI002888A8C1|nr:hypothetical protein [Streptomyces sp. DSM 41633]
MADKRGHTRNNRIASPVRQVRGVRFASPIPDPDAEAIKEIEDRYIKGRQRQRNDPVAPVARTGGAKAGTCKGCGRVKPSLKAYCPACIEQIRTGKLKP